MNMTYYCKGKMTLFILSTHLYYIIIVCFYTILMYTVSLIYLERGLYLENKLLSLSPYILIHVIIYVKLCAVTMKMLYYIMLLLI